MHTCELHPGECDGESWDTWGGAYPSWDDPSAVFSPDGESLITFEQRVMEALRRLADRPLGDTVVVVGHSGFIEAATLALMGGLRFSDTRPFMINGLKYTSITEWRKLSDGRWLLERYNDAAHLAGVGASTPGGAFG